jgi:oxygen-dependent protoporphyrinogen oxidase
MKYDVAVIGAGITGLTAAYKLSRKGYKVIVLEKANRVGGNITTKEVNLEGKKYLIEEGPQTILANNRAVWELINELGLKPQKASPYSEKRYIYKKGKLIPIPLKPLEFFKTPLVSFKAKLQLFKELFVKPSQKEDESVAKFTIRHFGREFLDYFVQPFVSGIYAGDAEKLSVRYAFPKLYEIERKYGSLLKAFIKEKRVSPKGDLISFPKGLKEFTDTLAEKVKVELNTEVETISKNPSLKLYEVRTNQKTCLLYTSPSPRDRTRTRMPSSA